MRRVLFLAAILGSGLAMAEEIEIYIDKARPVASLSRVVEPAYPKALLAAGKGGHVDITGTVSPVGELENATYTPDSPASQAFVEPLREVVPFWKFDSETDDKCRPVTKEVTTRMFFEVVDGKPKVSVTQAIAQKAKPEMRPIKRVRPDYPRRPQAAGHESTVYASAEITPEGNVASTQAWPYPSHLSGTIFRDTVQGALMQWQFPATSSERKRRVCIVQEFKLVN